MSEDAETIPFQAIILCGPGSSFPTFTTNADQNPKALLPIANRPMVWYAIDFCRRMLITGDDLLSEIVILFTNILADITLIAPPSAAPAINTALKTNPQFHLANLPMPNLLAPKDLDHNTSTAQIFRLPEVKAIVKRNFIVLPCDLVCELGGETFLDLWAVQACRPGGKGNSGGLGVFYQTKTEPVVKGEETNFIATSALSSRVHSIHFPLFKHVSKLVYSVPTDTLNDITESKEFLPIRHSLLRAHPRVKMLSSHRDAHIYLFPAWVMDLINSNERMESIEEDVIGWWAKAGWQDGLGEKLGLRKALDPIAPAENDENATGTVESDFEVLCSTYTTNIDPSDEEKAKLVIPPLLAYVHPSKPAGEVTVPLIRRVDTGPLLLSVSLQLAKLEGIDTAGKSSSPFAHASKVAYPEGIAARTTVTRPDCLLAENVIVEEKSSIKECVIGANCTISTGAKLLRCVLMDGVLVGKNCKLTGCILGRRSRIGDDSVLQDCEVQENLVVLPKSTFLQRFPISKIFTNILSSGR